MPTRRSRCSVRRFAPVAHGIPWEPVVSGEKILYGIVYRQLLEALEAALEGALT